MRCDRGNERYSQSWWVECPCGAKMGPECYGSNTWLVDEKLDLAAQQLAAEKWNRRVAERRKGDTVSTYLDLDDVCAGNPKAQEELAELRALRSKALCDRDHYQAMAEQRFAMRRELEELLGLEPDATYSEDQFKLALERLRKLVENEK